MASDAAPVIEFQGLELRFGRRTILNNLHGSLSGLAIGLLGPNGAGKSTLIDNPIGSRPFRSTAHASIGICENWA
jgi:ABC-type multidrug transport system ATPase subunit